MTTAFITHDVCHLHEMTNQHPECPARLDAIKRYLQETKILNKLRVMEANKINREWLTLAHDENYIEKIFSLAPKDNLIYLDPDTAMNIHSLDAALYAVGSNVLAVDLLLKNKIKNAFCAVRPPGHHAEINSAMGFCLFNNIAIAAKYALENKGLKKVAIIDFDVHHGNGTEDIIANDDRILFCSSFQHPFYPFSGNDTESSHIINLPLSAGSDGKSAHQLMKEHWWPALLDFKPELIFISAGFDAHQEDPLGNLNFTTENYFEITQDIVEIAKQCCESRLVSSLEGGYNLKALAESVGAHINALL